LYDVEVWFFVKLVCHQGGREFEKQDWQKSAKWIFAFDVAKKLPT